MRYLTWWESAGRIKINLVDSGSARNKFITQAELKSGCDGLRWCVQGISFLDNLGNYATKEEAKEKMLAYVLARKMEGELAGVYFHELIPEVKAIGNKLTGGEICEQSATNW